MGAQTMTVPGSYSIGIEEEYFVFDARTRRVLNRANKKFLAGARKRLGEHVKPELLQSQIEVLSPPCGSIDELRGHLAGYRLALAEEAGKQGLGIAALGTFPLAYWPEQISTRKARYSAIMDDLQMLGLRNMLCGMHVHVEVPDGACRIDLMMRLVPYLPLLLALSVSSPFWQGHLTGLHGYRLAAYDELPRTGLPELFRTQADFDDYVAALVNARIMPDASYIWWALRPSLKYPTLELRVADSCTRLDDAVGIAALFRCLVRALDREPKRNAHFDRVGRAITYENKWRAERHGVSATFVEPFRRTIVTARDWLEEMMAMVVEDAGALDCGDEIAHLRQVVRRGTSADEQIRLYEKSRAGGRQRLTALKDVVDWAAHETTQAAKAMQPSPTGTVERASPSRAGHL
jgi:glutamate---cysteine ligase / carboxylate-amine ligase